jgi:small subunit ribosomal protein S1
VGDQVEIKVLEIKDTGKNMRIALTMKQLKPEPWSFIDSRFNVGDVVEGKVTRLAPFGCFVEISEGVEGLVHVSELSWERNNVKTEDIVKSGDMVSVKIIEIQMEKRKISLSFRQAGNDPWQDASEKYPVGSMVNGILEKKEKFGYFMTVAPGVTGLLPKSKIDLAVNAKEIENASIGDSIPLSVIDLNLSQRKMTLAPELEPSEDWRSFNQQTKKEEADDGDMGALGLALMQKLGK